MKNMICLSQTTSSKSAMQHFSKDDLNEKQAALPCRNCQVTFKGCWFHNKIVIRNIFMEKVTEHRAI